MLEEMEVEKEEEVEKVEEVEEDEKEQPGPGGSLAMR